MKYLVVILVVLAVVWLLRSQRRRDDPPPRASAPRRDAVQEMVDCAHCGVHLPATEAVRGEDGRHYCSPAHRLAGPR